MELKKIDAQNNPKSKIEEVLGKYNIEIDDAKVQEEVKRIITEKVPENDTLEVKKFLMGSVELTSLNTQDSDESIIRWLSKYHPSESSG